MPTSKFLVTGGCSTLSARSIARTRKVCGPVTSSAISYGDSHCSHGWLSIWQSKLSTGSFAANDTVVVVSNSIVEVTRFMIVVCGAVLSTTTSHVQLTGEASRLNWRSTARARKKWSPARRSVYSTGSGHSAHGSASSAHSKVAFGSSLARTKVAMAPPSGSWAKLGLDGLRRSCVSGGASSTTLQVWVEIGGSAASSGTSTRTSKVYWPRIRPLYVFGERHGENAPSSDVPFSISPDSEHSYMSAPGAEKTNVADLASVVIGGADVIVTGGAPPTISQLNSAGLRSTLPAASRARP